MDTEGQRPDSEVQYFKHTVKIEFETNTKNAGREWSPSDDRDVAIEAMRAALIDEFGQPIVGKIKVIEATSEEQPF